jgi:hypothetical protein
MIGRPIGKAAAGDNSLSAICRHCGLETICRTAITSLNAALHNFEFVK